MKKLLLVAVLLLGFSIVAVAQDTPAVEIFGGYSFFRPDTQGDDIDLNMHGWNGSIAINANKYVGFLADFSGYYDSISDDLDEADVRVHSMLFGPKFTARMGKVTPFAQALFGFTRLSIKSGDVDIDGETDLSLAFGGGIDINVNDVISVRPAQVDYFLVRQAGEFLNNFRYSAGIVFKLGKR